MPQHPTTRTGGRDVPGRITSDGPVTTVEIDLDAMTHTQRREALHDTTRGKTLPFAAAPAPAPDLTAEAPEQAGRRWGRRRSQAQDGPGEGVLELPEPQGFRLRRKPRRARRGWYAPVAEPALTSTRQAEILNTALVAAPTDEAGIIIGRDRLSNTLVAHDSFTAYEKKQITSPAVVALGVVGAGKSSLLKTVYVLRPLIMRGRRVVVMDKKDEGGEGEYCQLARQYGAEPLRFVIGGDGVRLNLFDPAILAGVGASGQARLLIAQAELANNSQPLDKWESAALRAAHRATLRAAEAGGYQPVLEHLLFHLGRVATLVDGRAHALEEFTGYSPAALEHMHQAGLGVRHLLAALLDDELQGLFDGPTSRTVNLTDKLTVFDVSQLPDEGPALAMVMAVANVWLMGTLRGRRGLRTNFIAEEGWALVGGPGGRVLQRNVKLARGLGLSNVAALHHVADIPDGDPAIAILKEAQTAHLFAQDRDEDVEAVARLYNLDPGSKATLRSLAPGHHLLKIGSRPEIHVQHVRSALERGLTNTDTAMLATGTRA